MMDKKKLNENHYLVFRRKEIQFEIPDDFPEDQIPIFTNLKDFKSWYKLQKFKPFEITEYSDHDYVIDFANGNKAKKTVMYLLDEINQHKHLIQGDGFAERIALSLAPERYFYELSKTYLTEEVYKKLKEKLVLKNPDQKFSETVLDLVTDKNFLQESSEPFIKFLFDEKVSFLSINFFDLNFSYFGSFEENDEWDENSEPPFTLKKVELLLKMCKKDINELNTDNVFENFTNLIKTSQEEKLKLILEKGNIPSSIIKKLIKENESMKPKFKSMLSNYK